VLTLHREDKPVLCKPAQLLFLLLLACIPTAAFQIGNRCGERRLKPLEKMRGSGHIVGADDELLETHIAYIGPERFRYRYFRAFAAYFSSKLT
jgi:hypothetical protein